MASSQSFSRRWASVHQPNVELSSLTIPLFRAFRERHGCFTQVRLLQYGQKRIPADSFFETRGMSLRAYRFHTDQSITNGTAGRLQKTNTQKKQKTEINGQPRRPRHPAPDFDSTSPKNPKPENPPLRRFAALPSAPGPCGGTPSQTSRPAPDLGLRTLSQRSLHVFVGCRPF